MKLVGTFFITNDNRRRKPIRTRTSIRSSFSAGLKDEQKFQLDNCTITDTNNTNTTMSQVIKERPIERQERNN